MVKNKKKSYIKKNIKEDIETYYLFNNDDKSESIINITEEITENKKTGNIKKTLSYTLINPKEEQEEIIDNYDTNSLEFLQKLLEQDDDIVYDYYIKEDEYLVSKYNRDKSNKNLKNDNKIKGNEIILNNNNKKNNKNENKIIKKEKTESELIDEMNKMVLNKENKNTTFKLIGEDIIRKEINSIVKNKKSKEEMFYSKKLKNVFNSIIKEDIETRPNLSKILLDNNLDIKTKTVIFKKYIKYVDEDKYLSDEADKLKMEIKQLVKNKKLITNEDDLYEKINNKIMPNNLKDKLKNLYNRYLVDKNEKLLLLIKNVEQLPFHFNSNILTDMIKTNNFDNKKIFISDLYKKLNEEIYGIEDTKDAIISFIAKQLHNPKQINSKFMTLQGSPGVGKTSLVQTISKLLDIPYYYINLSNIDNKNTLIGHDYTYEGSTYGVIASALMSNKCLNGIIFIDEIDKINEKIQNVFISILDPLTNSEFKDKYFRDFNIDLSKSTIILSLNDDTLINPILKSRLHIIKINDYNNNDKKNIISKFLIPKLKENYNVEINIEDTVIDFIIEETKHNGGIREINSYLTKIYDLAVLDIYTNKYNFNNNFTYENIKLLNIKKNINLPYFI